MKSNEHFNDTLFARLHTIVDAFSAILANLYSSLSACVSSNNNISPFVKSSYSPILSVN